jgi:hypothetical protein
MLSPHDIRRLAAILTDIHTDIARAMPLACSDALRSTLANYQSELIGLQERLVSGRRGAAPKIT